MLGLNKLQATGLAVGAATLAIAAVTVVFHHATAAAKPARRPYQANTKVIKVDPHEMLSQPSIAIASTANRNMKVISTADDLLRGIETEMLKQRMNDAERGK